MGGEGSGRKPGKKAEKIKQDKYKRNDPVRLQIIERMKAIDKIVGRANYEHFPPGNALEEQIISGDFLTEEERLQKEKEMNNFNAEEEERKKKRQEWEQEEQEREGKRQQWQREEEQRKAREDFQNSYKENNEYEFNMELDFINNVIIPIIVTQYFAVNPLDVMITPDQRKYLDSIRPETQIMKKTKLNYYLSLIATVIINIFGGAIKAAFGIGYVDFNQWKKEKEKESGYVDFEELPGGGKKEAA